MLERIHRTRTVPVRRDAVATPAPVQPRQSMFQRPRLSISDQAEVARPRNVITTPAPRQPGLRLSSAGVVALERIVDAMTAASPAASMTVVALDNGKATPLYQQARGVAGVGEASALLPASPERLNRVASISKSVTALLLTKQLAKRGLSWDARLLDVDVPMTRRLKGFIADGTLKNPTAWQSVTLRRLYNHTSGIAYDYLDDELVKREGRGITDDEMDRQAQAKDLFSGRRGEFAYSNVNYNILARLAGDLGADGTSSQTEKFQDQAACEIFRPLGMGDQAAYNLPHDPKFLQAHLTYGFDDGRHVAPVLFAANAYSGSAGLSISIDGLRRYVGALLELSQGTGTLAGLTQDQLIAAIDPEVAADVGFGAMAYARGFYWQSFGGALGFGHLGIDYYNTAIFVIFPESGIAVALTANSGEEKRAAALCQVAKQVHEVVAKDLAGRVTHTPPQKLRDVTARAKRMLASFA